MLLSRMRKFADRRVLPSGRRLTRVNRSLSRPILLIASGWEQPTASIAVVQRIDLRIVILSFFSAFRRLEPSRDRARPLRQSGGAALDRRPVDFEEPLECRFPRVV